MVTSFLPLLSKRSLLALTASLAIEGNLGLSPFWLLHPLPTPCNLLGQVKNKQKPSIPCKPEAFLQRQYFWQGNCWQVGGSLIVVVLKEVLGVAASFGSEVQLH